jgi:hypothetical protein
MVDDSDDSIVEVIATRSVRKTTTSGVRVQKADTSSLTLSNKALSQAQLSFVPVMRNGVGASAKRKRATRVLGSGDDEDPDDRITSYDVDEDWGTAKTDTLE